MVVIILLVYALSISFICYILYDYFHSPICKLNVNLNGKIIVVTGANTGIGKATAIDLLKRGAKVIFAGRDKARTMEVINSINNLELIRNTIYMELDLSNIDSITRFVSQIKSNKINIDILINNAGGMFDTFRTVYDIEYTIMTNYLGPFILTSMLVPYMNIEARIINVSSLGHEFITQKQFEQYINDISFTNSYSMLTAYGFSKVGNIIHAKFMKEYFTDNKIKIKIVSLHPGQVFTEINSRYTNKIYQIIANISIPIRRLLLKSAEEGAQTTIFTAIADYKELMSGEYYNNLEVTITSPVCYNKDNIEKMKSYTKNLLIKMDNVPDEINKYLI